MPDEYDCAHENTEQRYRLLKNGVKQYPKQCLRCGAQVEMARKSMLSAVQRWSLSAWDDSLRGQFWSEIAARHQAAFQRRRDIETVKWWLAYDAYLESPEWHHRRRLVLERDGYRCQARLWGCSGQAEEVHHLTYEHLRNEPLWELESVCRACHAELTAQSRAARGALTYA